MFNKKYKIKTLLSVLKKENILSKEVISQIENQKTLEKKKAIFLNVLESLPVNDYSELINCLSKHEDDLELKISENICKFHNNMARLLETKKNKCELESPTLSFYRNYLISYYISLPTTSAQSWCEISQKFTDVTIHMQRNKQLNPYSQSPMAIANRESEYRSQRCESYDEMFSPSIDGKNQLILIEGDAGTGKTTFSYKICKDWATGSKLQTFSLVILISLRDQKPKTVLTPKDLFAIMEGMAEKIYIELLRFNDIKILVWLEGWDELDDTYIAQSVFTDLLSHKILPQATVVVSTRPFATASMNRYQFTRTFKLQGFDKVQIKQCVNNYLLMYHPSNVRSDLSKRILTQIHTVHCLLELAEIPLHLAILLKLFEAGQMTLPSSLTKLYHDILLVILQYHKEKHYSDKKPIKSLDDLPPKMKEVLGGMEKLSYNYFSTKNPLSQELMLHEIFNSQEEQDFDGMGLFKVKKCPIITGKSKIYLYRFKVFQEFLAALYLTRLQTVELTEELVEIFGDINYERVWVFFSGMTKLKRVTIKSVLAKLPTPKQMLKKSELPITTHVELIEQWKQCHEHFNRMTKSKELSADFLLILMLCCYEAENPEACNIIADYFYPSKFCRIEISHSRATPYLFLAISYFMMHSGKKWSLRCSVAIQSSVQLLSKTIGDYRADKHEIPNSLWVLCSVVPLSDITAYCKIIESQPSLQWIHLLCGSYLGDDGTSKLCECLKHNNSVIKVEIDNCEIGSVGLKSIACMLNVNNTISFLNVNKNNFSLEDIIEFLHCIKNQVHLQYLLLDEEYTYNHKILSILEKINSFRKSNNAVLLMIINKFTAI